MQLLSMIEALLFVAGEEGLSLVELARLLEEPPQVLEKALNQLQASYQTNRHSALCLLETAKRYQLVTKPQYAKLLQQYAKTPMSQRLSRASLETLAIIAYKQPMTRVEVDVIRGVNSTAAISKLQLLGLIQEAGKKEVLGRPNLYETTAYFLDYLGLNSLEELPAVLQESFENQPIDLFYNQTMEKEEENANQ